MARIVRDVRASHLHARERLLLFIPATLAGAFGLVLLLVPGNRFVGAESVACALALALGMRSGDWTSVRLPTLAALAINVVALVACVATVSIGGPAMPRAYLSMCVLLIGTASAGLLLVLRLGAPRPIPDVARWIVWLVVVRTAIAAPLGLAPLLAPVQFVRVFGVPGADLFFYRVGGAALVGYAVMGIGELRSRCWRELRAPAVMVLVLAGLCAVVSVGSLVIGERSSLSYVVAVLACVVTAATVVELRCGGV